MSLTLKELKDILNKTPDCVLGSTVQVYDGSKDKIFYLDSVEDQDITPILSIVGGPMDSKNCYNCTAQLKLISDKSDFLAWPGRLIWACLEDYCVNYIKNGNTHTYFPYFPSNTSFRDYDEVSYLLKETILHSAKLQPAKWYIIRKPTKDGEIEGGYVHWLPEMEEYGNKVLKSKYVVDYGDQAIFENIHSYIIHQDWVEGPYETEEEAKEVELRSRIKITPKQPYLDPTSFGPPIYDKSGSRKYPGRVDFEPVDFDSVCHDYKDILIGKNVEEATITSINSIAFGSNSKCYHNDTILLGSNLQSDQDGQIKIGNPEKTTTIEIGGIDLKQLEFDVKKIASCLSPTQPVNFNSIDEKYDAEIEQIVDQYYGRKKKISKQVRPDRSKFLIVALSSLAIGTSAYNLIPLIQSCLGL